MVNMPALLEKLNSATNVPAMKAMFNDPLKEHIEEMDKFQQMVEQTIDLDAADQGDFFVKPEFDEELKGIPHKKMIKNKKLNVIIIFLNIFIELKSNMQQKEEKMQSALKKAADDLDMEAGKSIKLETNAQFGYHFKISLKEEKKVRSNKSYTILDSLKAGIRFRSQRLNELNEDWLSARASYLEQQKTIVSEIIDTACI